MSTKLSFMKKLAAVVFVFIFAISMAACSSDTTNTESSEDTSSETTENKTESNVNIKHPGWYKVPSDEELKQAQLDDISNVILSSGPHGETAVPANEIVITDEQLEEIKKGNFKAAISMGFLGDDWSEQQLAGLKAEFDKMGIEIVVKTNADFKDTQQISDLETISARKPDILVSIPLNGKTTASAYKKLADAGTKIVFMDQPAEGMEPGKDYVSVVSADNFGLGMNIADELAKAINGEGEVVALYYAPDFYVTNQRYQGFVARLQAKYPKVKLLAAQGFQDPNTSQEVASALLTKYPNINGMYASWDTPALGAIAAARVVGRTPADFTIAVENLGSQVTIDMAQKGFIHGIGAQRPYDQGVTEAKLAALAMIGVDTPTYVAVPSLAVNRENLAAAYKEIYHKEAPGEILNELNK
jgi:ribose transport system substrate-binding protein